MRMREVGGEIRLYDVINPTFTVMTDSGRFANAGFKMIDDYQGFYNETRRIIEEKNRKRLLTINTTTQAVSTIIISLVCRG